MNIRQTEGKFLSVDEFTERKNSLQEEDERSVSSCSQRTGCTDHSSAVLQDHPSSEVHVLNNRDIGSCEDLTSTPSIVSDDTESFYSVDSSFSRQNTTESDETLNSSRSSLSTCSFHSTDTVKSTDLYYSTTNVNSDNAINDTCSNFNNTSSVSYDLLSTGYKMDSGSDVSQLGEKQELKIKPKKSLISSLRKGKKQVKRTKSDITSLEVPIKKNDRDTKSDDEFPEDGSLGELGSETLSADDGSFSEVNDGTKLKVKAYERSPKIKSPKKDSTLKRSFFRKKDKDSRILKQSSEHSDALDTDNSIIDIEGADDNDSLSLSPKNLPKSLPAPSDQQGEIPHPIIKKEKVGSETIKPTNDQSIASLSSKIIVRQSSAGSSLVGSEKLQSTEKPAKDDTDVVVLQKPEKLEEISIPISLSETKVASSNLDKNEHLFKILVIGELGTGKTSIIKLYVHQFFSQHYRATIGVDFALKTLNWDSNTVIRLQLWDIAGQERFGSMTRVYYKEAVGAFIVFDVSKAQTFDCVNKWKTDLDSKVLLPNGDPIPTVLLANKCDLPKEGLVNNPVKMDEYCKESGYVGWFETSAKKNINIDQAVKFLVSQILTREQEGFLMTDSLDKERLTLDTKRDEDKNKADCKC